MPKEGMDRRDYRFRKFDSWEHSLELSRGAAPVHATGSGVLGKVAHVLSSFSLSIGFSQTPPAERVA